MNMVLKVGKVQWRSGSIKTGKKKCEVRKPSRLKCKSCNNSTAFPQHCVALCPSCTEPKKNSKHNKKSKKSKNNKNSKNSKKNSKKRQACEVV